MAPAADSARAAGRKAMAWETLLLTRTEPWGTRRLYGAHSADNVVSPLSLHPVVASGTSLPTPPSTHSYGDSVRRNT